MLPVTKGMDLSKRILLLNYPFLPRVRRVHFKKDIFSVGSIPASTGTLHITMRLRRPTTPTLQFFTQLQQVVWIHAGIIININGTITTVVLFSIGSPGLVS